ncbi:MAG TPA: protein kinase [Gaiellaceae bacterium]|nr:protein kinase [Gaiellaceae bacterium]
MVGDVLSDRYEVEELVGTGGMSSVYRARDQLLGRMVALKVLHQQYTEDADYVERFRREARAVAALSHPNIVTVIDRGEHEGRPFIVFEYVDGENLKKQIERLGPAPVDEALELALQVARGLSFAHQNGLVHRDVKPQNVLLNGDGQAKVTDFGIARSLDVQHGMTQTGTVLGTSDYIAPEQAQGHRVDEHTDVYSLGVVLYELLTGEVPFPGENFVAVAMRHINEPPPPIRDRRPDVSPRLEAAVHRAMAKDPHDRFQTMAELADELDACLAEVADGGVTLRNARVRVRRRRAPRRRGGRRWMIAVLLLMAAALAAAAAAAFLYDHSRDDNGGSPAGSAQTTPPHLRGAGAFDPYGTGGEHDAEAPNATDGDSGTYWPTESYSSSFAAIGKPGVGLVLDAGRAVRLRQVGIVTDTPGFTAVIRAGDSRSSFPNTISASKTVGRSARFTITGDGEYRYFLVWITALADGYDVAHVNEVKAA